MHIDRALGKANSASGIIARLGGVRKGMTGMAVRNLFLACVRPIFDSWRIRRHRMIELKIRAGTATLPVS
jgi:hypothetical protein